eukprot:858-Heterococcus_DN1.PRE.2
MPYVSLEQDALRVRHDGIHGILRSCFASVRGMYTLLQDDDSPERTAEKALWHARRIRFAFWFLGLFSSTGYVIMVAGAKEINSGGVGLVFLCDVAPGFFVKLSAPYWFHLVPHSQRSALGEASFLSLAARYDSGWALTMWSSGTGFAGVFGKQQLFSFIKPPWFGAAMSYYYMRDCYRQAVVELYSDSRNETALLELAAYKSTCCCVAVPLLLYVIACCRIWLCVSTRKYWSTAFVWPTQCLLSGLYLCSQSPAHLYRQVAYSYDFLDADAVNANHQQHCRGCAHMMFWGQFQQQQQQT